MRYDKVGAPGFCVVAEGSCELTLLGHQSFKMRVGDFLFLPSTPALEIRSKPGVGSVLRRPDTHEQRYGRQVGEPDFRMLAGTFQVVASNAMLLRELLPETVYIPACDDDKGRLAQLVQLLVEECLSSRPAYQDAMKGLMEVCLIHVVRWLAESGTLPSVGLLNGLKDAPVSAAICAMHANVRREWTVAKLATLIGMSRSAFAARFTQQIGFGPIEYLSRWRMSLAREALIHDKVTLEALAQSVGYQSASALSTAFRRRMGCSPAHFVRDLGRAL